MVSWPCIGSLAGDLNSTLTIYCVFLHQLAFTLPGGCVVYGSQKCVLYDVVLYCCLEDSQHSYYIITVIITNSNFLCIDSEEINDYLADVT